MQQKDFPACAVNHNPLYYCCEFPAIASDGSQSTEKELFTRFQKPQGGAYSSFYDAGWSKLRQVSFPVAQFSPDSPEFDYNDPNAVCRIQRIVFADGTSKQELQCGAKTAIKNSYGGTIVTNTSVASTARDASVFWTSRTNLRNNNASFPIGATCKSLMTLPGGKVDDAAKAACRPTSTSATPRYTTYSDGPVLLVFIVYGLFAVLLLLWWPLRALLAVLWGASAMTVGNRGGQPSRSLRNPDGPKDLRVSAHNAKFVDEPNALAIPMLTHRSSEIELRAAAEAIEQTGYQDSRVGKAVFAYLVLTTLLLFPVMVILVEDNNGRFSPPLFDPVKVLIVVFIVWWVFMSAWLLSFVILADRMINFFRVKQPLDRCQYVHLFNPEAAEILMSDRSGISSAIRKLQALVLPRTRLGYEETVKVKFTEDGHRYVEFQHMRYLFDELYGKFMPGSLPFPDTFAKILEQRDGLQEAEYARRTAIVGHNSIQVPMPSWKQSVSQEVFQFFYVYQLMCYLIWYFTGNWEVALANMLIIVVVMVINIISKRRLLAAVLQMTQAIGGVAVQRDGVWQTIKASQVVPGDLVRVAENWDVPCDLVVIKGNVLCDESALTGESMPVQKFAIPTTSRDLYDPEDPGGKKYTLFAGAKTLYSGKRRLLDDQKNEEILAIVYATGAHTVRGQLIQSILYPAKVRFKYNEHLKAFIVFLILFGAVAAAVAMRLLITNAGLSNTLFAFVYGMFMMSAVVNPLIPVVVTIGQVNATRRLQKRGIICLNPERIALGGKVRVFAFDKTGTITKAGLDFRGCLPTTVVPSGLLDGGGVGSTMLMMPVFESERRDMTSADVNPMLAYALASCHAVGYMEDKLVGNEVEVQMFASTQWKLVEDEVLDASGQEAVRTIVESPDGGKAAALELLKRFEFDHHRMCMSVVVQDLQSNRRFVFTKGAYEKLAELSRPDSVPSDYLTRADKLARDGCYVLGHHHQQEEDSLTRDEAESELTLLGLLLFQNELKADSAQALAQLRDGGVRAVMITGDNAMTGCFIARASGLVPAGARVVLGDILAINEQGGRALVWKDVDTLAILSNKDVLKLVEDATRGGGGGGTGTGTDTGTSSSLDAAPAPTLELAVTGPAFNYLGKMGELSKLLFHVRIFARMTPVEKADCVAEMMMAGAVTGMCGDGGNDCGALRTAHVGVALSDAEASVVAPFTSQTPSIAAVVDVCREGRCTLATTFGNLKFLVLYGLIGVGLRVTMYSNSVFVSRYSFIVHDGLILLGLSYAITLAKPAAVLGRERPTSSLVGATTLLSLVGQEALHVGFLYASVHTLMSQSWYCPFSPEDVDLAKGWLLEGNPLSSTLFLAVSTQYMASAASFGFGATFHQPVYKNWFLAAYFGVLLAALLYLALGAPSRATEALRIATSTNIVGLPDIPLPASFQRRLVLLMGADMLAVLAFEFFVVAGPIRRFARARFHKDRLRLRLDNAVEDANPPDAHDADHFFSIETRVELKERLAVLQRQLAALLVQTKLAWMKCFADVSAPRARTNETDDSGGDPRDGNGRSCDAEHTRCDNRTLQSRDQALLAASELVTKGERVTAALQRAFAKASPTSKCPIKQYQDLVERVERDFADFQRLVTRIARSSSFMAAPVPSTYSSPASIVSAADSSTPTTEVTGRVATTKHSLKPSASEPTMPHAVLSVPVSYDLPSMKSYCARVAPPYSSYLAKKS
ncbi:hypothetical protein PybrP1_000300 [[Pythium] brassicae (nom. inval.)]|nr:hypothetical protein PybrP1_000300 [[Pythium] brassicae (nom. inval.)]